MHAPSQREVAEATSNFAFRLAVANSVLLVLHLLPMSQAPWRPFRLGCTLAFFGSAIGLIWLLLEPRSKYLHLLYAWRFEDAPPSMDRAWRRYLYSLDRLSMVLGYTLLVLVATTGIAVLRLWFFALTAILPLSNLAWWLALIVLILLPFAGGFLFTEVFQRYRQLHEQVTLTTWFTPRPLQAVFDAHLSSQHQENITVLRERAFRAGGVDWDWEEFFKNCVVFGQTGSGKTVCVLNTLLDSLLASTANSAHPPSALILDPKGDFRGKIETLCKKHGRAGDLLRVDPARLDQSIRWNPLDSRDDELELAARFAATMEALGMKQQDTSFWVDSAKKFLRHAIALVRLTNPPGEPPSFRQLAQLASSFERVAERTDRLDLTDERCDACLEFFGGEWCDLADETRTSIQAYITNMIDPFLMQPYASLFSGRSTMRIADMVREGKILYVDMPIADKEAMARTIGTFIKLEFFREVLTSPNKPRPSFFLCDEFQVFFTTSQGKGDADFFERSRQSNHVNIIATQNLPSLLKQSPKKEPVMNLLGNCAIKIFLRNTDTETNRYASEQFGQQLVAMGGASGGGGSMGIGRFSLPGAGQSASSNDQYDQVVRSERFAELAIPARGSDVDYCESILHHAARPEMDGQPRKLRWRIHPV